MNEAPGQFKYNMNGAYVFELRMKMSIDNMIGETKC